MFQARLFCFSPIFIIPYSSGYRLVSIHDRLIGQSHEIVADGVEPEIRHNCPIKLKQHDGHQILLWVRIPGSAKCSRPEKRASTLP